MIHVACNIDKNYVKYCAVTLVSLFLNNRKERFSVHIIADGLTDYDKDILSDLVAGYGNKICFYPPDKKLLEGFTIRKFSKRITLATYYRCILSEILPDTVDRVLYLDCDIIVAGDVCPLWNIKLAGVGVAAVEDVGCDEAERYDVLKYPQKYSYFNAGVLLINLDYWRKHNVAASCVEYYRKYPERILFNDQDLLNSVLYRNKIMIDLCWNVQDGFYRNPETMTQQWKEKYAESLKHPIIIHYTNRKPWDYDSLHPLRHEYFRYLSMTPFKDDVTQRNPLLRVKRFFRLLPFSLGLRRRKYIDMSKL